MRVFSTFLFCSSLFVAACSGGATPVAGAPETSAVSSTVATTVASPVTTLPVTTAPATTAAPPTTTAPPTTVAGAPGATCINGWTTPAPGTPLRKQPLDLIRRYLGLPADALFIVEEMRYFTGPEDVEIIAPRRDVERWYVEAHLQSDPSVAGRWIVRYISDDMDGVMAAAPAGTTGFGPGIWTSYTADEGERTGEAYDPFTPACTAENGPYCQCNWGVDGCSCDDEEVLACTGIPPTVMGCLDGL